MNSGCKMCRFRMKNCFPKILSSVNSRYSGLSIGPGVSSCNPPISPKKTVSYCAHFIDEGIETWRVELICPNQQAVEPWIQVQTPFCRGWDLEDQAQIALWPRVNLLPSLGPNFLFSKIRGLGWLVSRTLSRIDYR